MRCLKNWRIPRDFAPERIFIHKNSIFLSNEEKVIKFSGDPGSTKEPQIKFLRGFSDGFVGDEFYPLLPGGGLLGTAQRTNGWVIFRQNSQGDYSLNFLSTEGIVQQEIRLSDVFEEDFLQELILNESQMQCIEITSDNMKFLTKYLNIDESTELIGREIVLFSMGSTLNVLRKDEEGEWDISTVRSFTEDIKSLWYSSHWEAIVAITSLGVAKISFMEGTSLKEEIVFLAQKYLTPPKLLERDKLLGITWTSVDIVGVAKNTKFHFPVVKIPLPGVIDAAWHPTWGIIAVTENKFLYVLQEKQQVDRNENWQKNRVKFKDYITNLMENSSRMTMQLKEDNHTLNCLGFLRNFFAVTHEIIIQVSLRQTLGTNVEIEVIPSEKIVQMNISANSQWTLSIFNESFCQVFALNCKSYAFALPEGEWMASPLRVEVSTEFSIDGEHFLMSFPLRAVFRVQGAPPDSPLMEFYTKIEALECASIKEYAAQWAQIEQVNEKKLSALALKLQQMIISGNEDVEQVYKELRTNEGSM